MFWSIRNVSRFFTGLFILTVPGAAALVFELYEQYCGRTDPQTVLFILKMLLVLAIPAVCIGLAVGFRKLYKCLCEESYSVFARMENKK